LSTATAEELSTLSGIGPATADKIIAYRDEHGGFTSVEELDEVSGIGPSTIEKIRDLVTVSRPRRAAAAPTPTTTTSRTTTSTTSTRSASYNRQGKLNINRANAEELATLPSVGPSTAQRIIDYRTENGPFRNIEEIMNVSRIGQATFDKFKNDIAVR